MKKRRSSMIWVMAGLLVLVLLLPGAARCQLPPPPPPPPLPDPEAMRQVMGNFFRLPVPKVKSLEEEFAFPDLNLPVALFIAQQAHVSVDLLLPWRRAGRSWLQIAAQLKLPPTLFFLPLPEGSLGPPYGRAYGYYWKHKKDKKFQIVLSDREIADLVHLRIASTYFGLPPSHLIQLRAQGKPFCQIYGHEYRKRHPNKGGGPSAGGKGRPGPKGDDHGKGKGGGRGPKGGK